MGMFPGMRAGVAPFVTFVSMIPPLAILPILFISLGVGEPAKVSLIFIGIAPVIARDISGTVSRLPREQVTKALTLGGSLPSRGATIVADYRLTAVKSMVKLIDTKPGSFKFVYEDGDDGAALRFQRL